jgi:hypothetical protein
MDALKLEEQRKRIHSRIGFSGGMIPAFRNYTGVGVLGKSTMYNSPMSGKQLELALVLSNHELIQKLMEDNNVDFDSFQAEPLIQARILQGMKILDLGCGYEPAFARCARALGSETYTVDVIPAEDFRFYDFNNHFTQVERDAEVNHHIQTDLNDPKALEKIINASGGNFDLVTSAHLHTGGFYKDREYFPRVSLRGIVKSLLKDGGVYYRSEENQITSKQECSLI